MALRSAAERTPINSTNAGSGAASSMASRNVAKRHRRAYVSAYQAGKAGSEAIRFGKIVNRVHGRCFWHIRHMWTAI
jgi:hypothetical protein